MKTSFQTQEALSSRQFSNNCSGSSPSSRVAAAIQLIRLFCMALICAALMPANGATVRWHQTSNETPPTGFVIMPTGPTTNDVIGFVVPTDGILYVNECYASVSNGTPSISVDSTNHAVTVSFSAPVTNVACPQIVSPVCGVEGDFGSLEAGVWFFKIRKEVYSFEVFESRGTNSSIVRWHPIDNSGPPQGLRLNPAYPTITDVISFVAPTDGKIYANECFASTSFGVPMIYVDLLFRRVNVSFSAPPNWLCPDIVLPVSGVEGEFGPLGAGAWGFNILGSTYTFTVNYVPMSLSVQPLANSSSLQISWPNSGEVFRLESCGSLSTGIWQVVTNIPVSSANQVAVQIETTSGTRFFRLHRLVLQ